MSIARATAEIAELREKAAQLREQFDRAMARITKLEAYVEVVREYGPVSTDRGISQSRRGGPTKADRFADAVEEILREIGGALPTAEISNRLAERGMPVGGSNPVTNLSSILYRSKRFQNDRRLGWSLKAPEATGHGADVRRDGESYHDTGKFHGDEPDEMESSHDPEPETRFDSGDDPFGLAAACK